MGWLDIIPLLQKALPLLVRAVPMLEVFVNTRGNARDEMRTTLDQFSTQLRGELAASNGNHTELADAIAANNEHLKILSADLTRLRTTTEEQSTRLATSEAQIATMAGTLRTLLILTGVLLLICIVLLILLLTHHA